MEDKNIQKTYELFITNSQSYLKREKFDYLNDLLKIRDYGKIVKIIDSDMSEKQQINVALKITNDYNKKLIEEILYKIKKEKYKYKTYGLFISYSQSHFTDDQYDQLNNLLKKRDYGGIEKIFDSNMTEKQQSNIEFKITNDNNKDIIERLESIINTLDTLQKKFGEVNRDYNKPSKKTIH